MNFQTMSKQRKYVLIASAVGIVSLFLPWITISIFGATGSANAMHGSTGYFLFVLFIVSGYMAYQGDQTTTLKKTNWAVVLICGILATIWMLLTWLGASDNAYGASLAFGFYLSLLSSIGVLASAFMFRSPTDNLKDGFNSLRGDIKNRMNSTTSTTATTTPATTSTTTPPTTLTDVTPEVKDSGTTTSETGTVTGNSSISENTNPPL